MIYPLSHTQMDLAKLYAIESHTHTANYAGWEGEDGTKRKLRRIKIGRLGQLWFARLLQLNKIACEVDETGPESVDDFDIRLGPTSVDVKTTVDSRFIGQVSPGVRGKNIDFFCFLQVSRRFEWIEFVGWISALGYFDCAAYISQGEVIPNTNIKQLYKEGSYFIERSSLRGIESFFDLCRTLAPQSHQPQLPH